MLAAAFDATRMDFTWSGIEVHCGTYDWSAYDVLMASVGCSSVAMPPWAA